MNFITNHIQFFAFAFTISIISAIQPGLVNLSVAKASANGNNSEAKLITRGAAVIEVIYGLVAIMYGNIINNIMLESKTLKLIVVTVLLVVGIVYMIRKNLESNVKPSVQKGFFKGMVLNLISIQVFLFWILAITISSAFIEIRNDLIALFVYALGIGFGKILILFFYQVIGVKILQNLNIIKRNTNKIIGLLLIGAGIIQFIKI